VHHDTEMTESIPTEAIKQGHAYGRFRCNRYFCCLIPKSDEKKCCCVLKKDWVKTKVITVVYQVLKL
jgi:hypothetical protein